MKKLLALLFVVMLIVGFSMPAMTGFSDDIEIDTTLTYPRTRIIFYIVTYHPSNGYAVFSTRGAMEVWVESKYPRVDFVLQVIVVSDEKGKLSFNVGRVTFKKATALKFEYPDRR